jgi:hypothetical protein
MEKWQIMPTQVHCILGCNFFKNNDDEGGNSDDDLLHQNIRNQAVQGGGEFLN